MKGLGCNDDGFAVPFDCLAGRNNWREGWSKSKKECTAFVGTPWRRRAQKEKGECLVARQAAVKFTYFPLWAKGPACALALQHSGMEWRGEFPQDWKGLKPTTPFLHLPTLETEDAGTSQKSQKMSGAGAKEFAVSQQLMQQAEDIYQKLSQLKSGMLSGEAAAAFWVANDQQTHNRYHNQFCSLQEFWPKGLPTASGSFLRKMWRTKWQVYLFRRVAATPTLAASKNRETSDQPGRPSHAEWVFPFNDKPVGKCAGFEKEVSSCLAASCLETCEPVNCEFSDWSHWSNLGGCFGLCQRERSIIQRNNDCGRPCHGPRVMTKGGGSGCMADSRCQLQEDVNCHWDALALDTPGFTVFALRSGGAWYRSIAERAQIPC
eukprot:g30671.t1